MDLPSCPACGQSVLDDDAESCPFCGASMSGKPGAQPTKSPTPARAKPKPAPVTSSETTSATKSVPSKDSAIEADDPISAEKSESAEKTVRKVVVAKRKPERGRMHRVVCPMCDTAGFIPKKAAGMDVKCPNPECMIPIFSTEPLETEPSDETEDEVKSGGMSPVIKISIGALVLGAIAVGVYFAFFKTDGTEEIAGVDSGDYDNSNGEKNGEKNGEEKNGGGPVQPVDNRPTPAEIQKQALDRMEATSVIERQSRTKPYRRKLSAEAYALTGDIQGALGQLKQLFVVENSLRHYAVEAMVEIAWQQLALGQNDEADKTIANAQEFTRRLPTAGRDRLDSATALAAVLVVLGKTDDATALLKKHHDAGTAGQLSAFLAEARGFGSYEVDAAVKIGPVVAWRDPQSVAVTVTLVAKGYVDEALSWAKSRAEADVRDECLIAWAEAVAVLSTRGNQANLVERIEPEASSLSATARARLYARVAGRFQQSGHEAAESWLNQAVSEMQGITVPEPAKLPDLVGIYNYQPPENSGNESAAIASAEVARVQSQLGQREAAWQSLTNSLAFARAIAPSPVETRRRIEQTSQDVSGTRSRLRSALELDSADEARQAYVRYRQKAGQIEGQGQARFDLQTELLSEAAHWSLTKEIWGEVNSWSTDSGDGPREPYFWTAVPWLLLNQAQADDDSVTAKAIQSQMSELNIQPQSLAAMQRGSTRLFERGEMEKAAKRISDERDVSRSEKDQWSLRMVCRILDEQNRRDGSSDTALQDAFRFANALDYSPLRNDALRLIAGRASVTDRYHLVWEAVKQRNLDPAEEIAVLRGLVGGIVAGPHDLPDRP